MIVTGKVTGIKKFGAFVTLEDKRSGLVHISEVANTYVDDVAAHLTEGQEVKVKIIGIDENGRINLSIKKAEERPSPPPRSAPGRAPQRSHTPPPPATFEDRLKQFMQESNTKMSGCEMYAARRSSRRKTKG
ncbi:MAG: S1 RNA-binding domain-containing protein [Oscillospiraceae bacterium]|nr:S1 RNA-binding domain-containing protein [Oscillospiraceae bacterium]